MPKVVTAAELEAKLWDVFVEMKEDILKTHRLDDPECTALISAAWEIYVEERDKLGITTSPTGWAFRKKD